MMQNNQAIPFNKENFKQIFSIPFISVIIISIPSAIIAEYFNIPLAWFLGPMLITSLASLMGLKTKMPRLVLSSILIILGLYIGNYIDKDLFSQMQDWIWTSFIMLIYIILSVLIVSKYLEKFSKYEKKTSIFSAAPGALGPLMILAEDAKTDLSQVATSHLIRLIIIITVFPFIVNSFYDVDSVNISEEIITNQNLYHLMILIASTVILILFFEKIKVPAALLTGTLVASGLLQITEVASYQISPDIIDYCLLILGSSVNDKYTPDQDTLFLSFIVEVLSHQIDRLIEDENININSNGSFLRIGIDYNMFKNWVGMDNAIFVGLRYGSSNFSKTSGDLR